MTFSLSQLRNYNSSSCDGIITSDQSRPGPAQGSDSVAETVALCRLVNSSGGGQWRVAVPGAGPWQCSSQANRPGPGTVVSGLSSGGQLNIGSGYDLCSRAFPII